MKDNGEFLVTTGIRGLDEIFYGGICKGNVAVVEGMPGSGKTLFALEFLVRGAQELNESGVMFLFETTAAKLRFYGNQFGWNIEDLEKAGKLKFVTLSPQTVLNELESPSGTIVSEIASSKAQRVAFDGFTPFKNASDRLNIRSFRESIYLLFKSLRQFDVTAVFTTESVGTNPIGEATSHDEQYLADSVLTIRNQARRRSVHRSIEITKSRGQDFVSGRHSLKIIAGQGLQVYPRVYARPRELHDQPTSEVRVTTGNPTLDDMLGGGPLQGSVTLIVGISGTGKTIAGLQFLTEAAKSGHKGLLVSLDEHPQQIKRNAESIDLDFKEQVDAGQIFIHYDSPLEVDLDEHFYSIKELIEEHGITRVVIDSVAAYESAQPEEAREFLVALAAYFKENLIPSFMNFECPELLGISQISDHLKSSAMVDNIVLLNFIEISTLIRRAITIPKARGSKPDQRTREYVIQSGGLTILDDRTVDGLEKVPQLPLSSYYSVLGRAPTRHSPVIDESVAAGRPLPKTKVPKPAQRVSRTKSRK